MLKRGIVAFILLSFIPAIIISAIIFFCHIRFSSFLGIALLAVFYMPAPIVSAFIVEKRFITNRIYFPNKSNGIELLKFLLLPGIVVGILLLSVLSLTFIIGNMLQVVGVGSLVTNLTELQQNVAQIYGQNLANSAKYPPSIPLFLLVTFFVAFLAGWSINGVFAFGEEYGWRGYLWENWKHVGYARANVAIGIIWGLWHAPIIIQGYNYPGYPILGIFLMMMFTISLSFLLSAIRESTKSVLPVAATHGAINGIAALVVVLTKNSNPLVDGLLGIFSCITLFLLGMIIHRRLIQS